MALPQIPDFAFVVRAVVLLFFHLVDMWPGSSSSVVAWTPAPRV